VPALEVFEFAFILDANLEHPLQDSGGSDVAAGLPRTPPYLPKYVSR